MIEYLPTRWLRPIDRVLALAPSLTWRWRFALFLEALARHLDEEREPSSILFEGGI